MKYALATLALILAIAFAAGFVAFRASGDPAVEAALKKHDAMEWLRTDFDLTDQQFTAIKKLHDSYSVVCEEHCREIGQAVEARNTLSKSSTAGPAALAAADRRVEELRLICESAIETHVRECASHMAPEAGRRYLALVLPRIHGYDHRSAPDMSLGHRHH